MTRRISGLSEIARDFDAMLIDQFGVIAMSCGRRGPGSGTGT